MIGILWNSIKSDLKCSSTQRRCAFPYCVPGFFSVLWDIPHFVATTRNWNVLPFALNIISNICRCKIIIIFFLTVTQFNSTKRHISRLPESLLPRSIHGQSPFSCNYSCKSCDMALSALHIWILRISPTPLWKIAQADWDLDFDTFRFLALNHSGVGVAVCFTSYWKSIFHHTLKSLGHWVFFF